MTRICRKLLDKAGNGWNMPWFVPFWCCVLYMTRFDDDDDD